MVTQTGWVSRLTVLWVTGQQPVTLCWTSPGTTYCSLRNFIETHNVYCHEPMRPHHVLANSHQSLPVSSFGESVCMSMYMCTFFLLYCSIPFVMYCLTVHMHIYWYLYVCVCVGETRRSVQVGQSGLCRLASCPHLLHCHHVCCVDVTTPPASLLSSPPHPTPLWEHLTPLIPRRGHTQCADSQPIKLNHFPYANDSQHSLLNVVNCHFYTDTVIFCLFICPSLLQLGYSLRCSMINSMKLDVIAGSAIFTFLFTVPLTWQNIPSCDNGEANTHPDQSAHLQCILNIFQYMPYNIGLAKTIAWTFYFILLI